MAKLNIFFGKKPNYFYLYFLIVSSFLISTYSCVNNDSSYENLEPDIEESASLTYVLNEMEAFFDNEGNPTSSQNPTGNFIMDFCFDFVYPITLIYNTGATVTVSNFDDFIAILLNTSENLYLTGIDFPFQVQVYNEETQSIEIITIENESQFQNLINSCNFNDCNCPTEYDPVCVSIGLPDGTYEIIEYPNQCVAACYGFSYEDFLDCNSPCNCPLTTDLVCIYDSTLGIIEFNNACEAQCEGYTPSDFVDCNGCSIYAVNIFTGDCYTTGTYYLFIDFEYSATTNYSYFDIYLENNEYFGSIPLSDLPVVILNFPMSGNQNDFIKICIDGGTDCCIEDQWLSPNCGTPIPPSGQIDTQRIIYRTVNRK